MLVAMQLIQQTMPVLDLEPTSPRWRVYYRANLDEWRMVEAILKEDQYYSQVPWNLGLDASLDNIASWP